jgi:hypothetical protein
MKFKFLIALALVTVLSSCSSDDNSGDNGDNIATNYLPLETGKYWTYRVVGAALPQKDSLYVANDTVINAKTYKKMKTLNQPIGFFSNSLHNNGLRKEGSSLLVSGTAGLDLGNALPINFSLNDFVIFKENALANDQLSSVPGVINQTVSGYPLTINYTMTSTALETLTSFSSPDGKVYTDVKKVKITLNLTISTLQTIPGTTIQIAVPILNPQDVVTSIQYYSKNIGMVYTNTITSYHLQDLSQYGVTLPIPQDGSQTQGEFLDTHSAN